MAVGGSLDMGGMSKYIAMLNMSPKLVADKLRQVLKERGLGKDH